MSSTQVGAPSLGASLLIPTAERTCMLARLLPVATAFARFGPELDRLCRLTDPSTAMTFSPAWWQAVPPPRGYAHRFLVVHSEGKLCAAVCLRERTVMGVPTGILHGSDAKGEGLVLCRAGEEARWLADAVQAMFGSRRCVALLLNRPKEGRITVPGVGPLADTLSQRTQPARFLWRTRLCPLLNDTLAPFGHRSRRNLRHALRRAAQNRWEFMPELTPAQVSEATTQLATRSTHPYTDPAITARLELERSQQSSFSMGLRSEQGMWLSLLSGVRRSGGLTDIFWQANVASGQDSVAIAMRALLMQHEGERGSLSLRFIGGTSPLMEHCCQPEGGTQTLITRPGLRVAVLRRLLRTRIASATNPMRRLLDLEPSRI